MWDDTIYNTDFNFLFDDLFNTTSNTSMTTLCSTNSVKTLSSSYYKDNYNQSLKLNMSSDLRSNGLDEDAYTSGDDTIIQNCLTILASDTGTDFIYDTLGCNFRINTIGGAITAFSNIQHEANFASIDVKNFINIYLSEFNTNYYEKFNSDIYTVDINALNTISSLTLSPTTIGYNTIDVNITGILSDDTTIGTTTLTTSY